MCLGMLCFLSLGIACAVYANSWGGPPDACEETDKLLGKDDICDSVPLITTNAIQAVSEAIKMCFSFYFSTLTFIIHLLFLSRVCLS